MDIERAHFWGMLPTILRQIAESHFVAFDLELSGIPLRSRRGRSDVRQTLSERYQELKIAAQTYHIVQVGITCVTEETENRRYILRSYNFNLSPLVYEDLDFERKFTYSSAAVSFLLSHGYQMDSPFLKGIPYLSAAEAKLVEERALKQLDKRGIPDIQLRKSDTQAREFVKRIRGEISAWEKDRKPRADSLAIRGDKAPLPHDQNNRAPLNGYEKRLVHQVVRNEFPHLHSFGKPDYIQILLRDGKGGSKGFEAAAQQRISEAICRQTGFRWIADALAGHSLLGLDDSGIDFSDESCYPGGHGQSLEEISSALQMRHKVLVGHNCFMDLVYFYQHFYGDLPDTLEQFQAAIQEKFDLVIDTKYLATSGLREPGHRNYTLGKIGEIMADYPYPHIAESDILARNNEQSNCHEAGFDSLITAQVCLKLAVRLLHEKASANPHLLCDVNPADEHARARIMDEIDASTGGSKNDGLGVQTRKKIENVEDIVQSKVDLTGSMAYSATRTTPKKNMYEWLSETQGNIPYAETPVSSSNRMGLESLSESQTGGGGKARGKTKKKKQQPQHAPLLPLWDADLWKMYGNKIRVYGTGEEAWDLSNREQVIGSKPTWPKPASNSPSSSIWNMLSTSILGSGED